MPPLALAATLAKYQLNQCEQPILAVCAGAEYGPAKRWPEEYYAQVANEHIEKKGNVWLFGSLKDKPITEKIMLLTQNRCTNLAGRLQLAETIDLLSLVAGVVTNDSGLMHIAAALHKPIGHLRFHQSCFHTTAFHGCAYTATELRLSALFCAAMPTGSSSLHA